MVNRRMVISVNEAEHGHTSLEYTATFDFCVCIIKDIYSVIKL